jgi:hypothetical protein
VGGVKELVVFTIFNMRQVKLDRFVDEFRRTDTRLSCTDLNTFHRIYAQVKSELIFTLTFFGKVLGSFGSHKTYYTWRKAVKIYYVLWYKLSDKFADMLSTSKVVERMLKDDL